jgi:hypothetical protein
MMDEPSSSPKEEVTTETRSDIKAAADILDARKKAVDDIVAGRSAPYFLAQPTARRQQNSKVLGQIRKRVLGYGDIWKVRYGSSLSWFCACFLSTR